MKNCPDIDKYDKNYDDLSESEVVELLSHAEICDYHNCLVSGYEESVMPFIDNYINDRNWIERGKQKIADYVKITPDITPEPPSLIILFGRQITANLALCAAIVVLSTTLMFAMILNNDKFSKSLISLNDSPKLTAGIDMSLSLTPPERKEILSSEQKFDNQALKNLVADLRKEVVNLSSKIEMKNKDEFNTNVSGYSLDKFKSLQNNTADSSDSNDESNSTKTENKTENNAANTPSINKNEQFELSNTNKNNPKPGIQYIGTQSYKSNKVVIPHGSNNVVLSNWETNPSKILGAEQPNEIIEMTFRLSENDNKALSIKAKIILDNKTYQIDLAKSSSGSYTIPVLKGSKFLVILETESKPKVREFYAIETKTFDFPDDD